MSSDQSSLVIWSSAAIRISHPSLDPEEITKDFATEPTIAYRPGESRVPYESCRSAGYWLVEHRADYPATPTVVFEWAEEFISNRRHHFLRLIQEKKHIDLYVGIHTRGQVIGFSLPPLESINALGIKTGIEIF